VGLENLTDAIRMVLYAWFLHLCSEKIQFAKILSVLSKENPYVFVKWEIKKAKKPAVWCSNKGSRAIFA
jgi:hypothetical protein